MSVLSIYTTGFTILPLLGVSQLQAKIILLTHHSMSPGPDIEMVPLIKCPYDFYEVLTFKWHVSKLSPIRLLVFKLLLFKWSYCRKFSKQWKIWILRVDKALLSDGKNTVQEKQWLYKCYSDSALSETMVKRCYADLKHGHTDTNYAETSGNPKSVIIPENTQKNAQNSFWSISNWCCMTSREDEDIRKQCILHFAWTFVDEKAVFIMGATFAHNRSKTTTHRRFRALFAIISTQ